MADADIKSLTDIVTRAADHALTLWAGGFPSVKRWEKEPGQPVCDADIAVDQMLREELTRLVPDAAWLSEETADDPSRLAARRLWVVDPIDGTRDYLAGKRGWAVSVALVDRGRPVMAVLSAPARNETWLAQAGAGARCNGRKLHAGDRVKLAGARVPAERLGEAESDFTKVERPNSIALRMAMVAADRADIVATMRWGNEWDIAAATLIAQEAGAVVSDALGEALRFNRPVASAFGVLCCAPGIYAQAIERLTPQARAVMAKDGKAG